MLRKKPFHPFLFSIYPVITLFSRLPGALPLVSLIRPVSIALCIPAVILLVGRIRKADIEKTAVLTSLAILMFSGSGHTYRLVRSQIWPSASIFFHLGIVVILTLMLILISRERVWMRMTALISAANMTVFLNIVSMVAVIFPIITIGGVWVNSPKNGIELWPKFVGENEPEQHLLSENPPDIYYIILDGYARGDVLKSVYGYDNEAFLGFLQERGFYIAEQSRSNYIHSFLSLGSSLNFDYLDFAEREAGKASVYTLPFRNLIQNSRSRTLLEAAGYQTVALGSDFPFTEFKNANTYLSPYNSNITELERYFLSTTAFEILYGLDWFFADFLLREVPLPSYQTRQNYILFALERLSSVVTLSSPKFVFAHIIIPHPPFVFDANGNQLTPKGSFSPSDGDAYQGSSEEYQANYLMQLEFINKEMMIVIDAILNNSPQPPIIILQADHGPGSLLYRDWIEGSCLWERASIMNAYYFPGNEYSHLNQTVTPVNTFRIIFNEFFNTNYEILRDDTYFSPISRPYDFKNITTRIEPHCE